MRCVLITPFGMPVEPEVNRIFATVSGPTLPWAASAAAGSASSVAKSGPTMISTPGGTTAEMARAYWALQAKTRPGVSRLKICRSLPKSDEISE